MINRNKTAALLMLVAAMMAFSACHHKKKEEGPTFTQTVTVAAEGEQKNVPLESLSSAIENIEQGDRWVTATKMAYTSGSPEIRLDVEENTTTDERKTNIIVTDKGEHTVILTVKQVKPGETPAPEPTPEPTPNYGIDDTHDTVTDQPAYSRQY